MTRFSATALRAVAVTRTSLWALLASLLLSHSAFGVIIYASEGHGTLTEGFTDVTISAPFPASISAGDLLLAVCWARSNETCDTPSGFSAVSVTNVYIGVYCKTAAGSETGNLSVTWTAGSSDHAWAQVYKWTTGATGYTCASLLAASAIHFAATENDIPVDALTVPNDSSLVFYAGSKRFGLAPSTPLAGFTEVADANKTTGSTHTVCSAYVIQTTKANITAGKCDGTDNTADETSVIIAMNLPSVSAPTFDTGVAYVSATATAMTVSFDASASAVTYYCALYASAATPTAAQVKAGTNAHSTVATNTTTGASQNVAITSTDSPVWPYYKPHCVIENAGGLSADSNAGGAFATSPMAAASIVGAGSNEAAQWKALTSVAAGSPAAIATLAYDGQSANFTPGMTLTGGTSGATAIILSDSDGGATGTLTLLITATGFQDNETLTDNWPLAAGAAVANGTASFLFAASDIILGSAYVQPCGNPAGALTIAVDGNYSTTCSGRQTAINNKVWDDSAVAYSGTDIDFYKGNTPPTFQPDFEQVMKTGVAIATIDFTLLSGDADSDALTYGQNTTSPGCSALPHGLTLGATTLTGTPDVENEAGAKLCLYVTDGIDITYWYFTVFPITSWTNTCNVGDSAVNTEGCITALTRGSVDISPATPLCSDVIAANLVSSITPAYMAEIAPGTTVTMLYSSGACHTAGKDFAISIDIRL